MGLVGLFSVAGGVQAPESELKGPRLLRPRGSGDMSRGPSSSASEVCIWGPQLSQVSQTTSKGTPFGLTPPSCRPSAPRTPAGMLGGMWSCLGLPDASHLPRQVLTAPAGGSNTPPRINCSLKGSGASLSPHPNPKQKSGSRPPRRLPLGLRRQC